MCVPKASPRGLTLLREKMEIEERMGFCSIGRRVPARVVLALLSFFGFFTNYMLRVNLNIAIVDMVKMPQVLTAQNSTDGSCASSVDNSTLQQTIGADDHEGELEWTLHEQGLVLASFYWAYILALVPGGLLAQKLGTKLVFGGANLVNSLVTFLAPFAARQHYVALMVVRLIQGLVSGATWPAMHVMVAHWIPPSERGKFVSTYYGNAVGTAVTYPLCGLLIDLLGWSAAFYIPAFITLFWCFLWWLLVFDLPAQHPRISTSEREYIETAVNPHLSRKKLPVPWKSIVTSVPLWALAVANSGTVWTFLMCLTYSPTYFKNVYGLSIRLNGLVSGLPNISRFIVALLFSWFAERLLHSNPPWSVTLVRKLATGIATLMPAALCLLITNVGCDPVIEVALFILISGTGGCASSGPLANSVDLAPNFAGTLLGLLSLLSMSSGFLVPSMVSALLEGNPGSLTQWRLIFIISACISSFAGVVFLVFGSGDVQWWNDAKKNEEETNETPLKQNSAI